MRAFTVLALVGLSFLAAACERTQVRLPKTADDTSATEPVVVRAALPGFEGKVTIDPAIALIIELRKKLEPRLRAELAEATVAAQRAIEARAATAPPGAPAPPPPDPPYYFTSDWTATHVGDRWYDIEGRTEQFTGGAHPNRNVELFVWDRLSDARLGIAELLKDGTPGGDGMKAFAAAAREALIAVKRERVPGYDPAKDSFINPGAAPEGSDPFAPDPANFPSVGLAPGPDGGVGGGLRVVFPLYSVGPYVDGIYDVVVPEAAIAAYLRPEFISQPK